LPTARYRLPAIALHWVHALAILTAFGIALSMVDLPLSPTRLRLFNWHKWAGISALGIAALRLAWRLGHAPPADAPMPAWQRRAAHAVHRAMYALFFAVPLAGWAYSSAAGFPVVLYGVLPLPDFVVADRIVAETIKPVHKALAALLGLAVVLHVAAALRHQFVDRDRLLARMWPGRDP